MNKFVATAALTFVAASVLPETGQAQSACGNYRVEPGDTLREIAMAAYGTDDYQPILEANADEIGRDPNLIRTGSVLLLPCLGVEPMADAVSADAVDPVEPDIFSLVTANGYFPYADESLPGGGIIATLIERAFSRADEFRPHQLTFVNDRAAHLDVLLPSQAFDASFPWTPLACEVLGNPTAAETYICENYIYSAPFYEIVEGFFARTGSGYEDLLHAEDFADATLCRPEGYSTSHLAEYGLLTPASRLIQPVRTSDCFDYLIEDKVDIVSFDIRTGRQILQELGLSDAVSENPNVVSIVPLQVAAHRDNPSSEILIATLNQGLREMQDTGEWQDLITRALQMELSK